MAILIPFCLNSEALAQSPSASISATEAVQEGTDIVFTVTLSANATQNLAVTVNVTEQGSFAAAGQTGLKTVTISSGSRTGTFTVSTTDDSVDEVDGRIIATITCSGSCGYVPRPASRSNVIPLGVGVWWTRVQDNDGEPTVHLRHDFVSESYSYTIDASGTVIISEDALATGLVTLFNLYELPARANNAPLITINYSLVVNGTTTTHTTLLGNGRTDAGIDLVYTYADNIDQAVPLEITVAVNAGTGYKASSDTLRLRAVDNDGTTARIVATSDISLTESSPTDTGQALIHLSRQIHNGEVVTVPLTLSTGAGIILPGSPNPHVTLAVSGTGVSLLTATPCSVAAPCIRFTGSSLSTVQSATLTMTPSALNDANNHADWVQVSLGTVSASGLQDEHPTAAARDSSQHTVRFTIADSATPSLVLPGDDTSFNEGTTGRVRIKLGSDPGPGVEVSVRVTSTNNSLVLVDNDPSRKQIFDTKIFHTENFVLGEEYIVHIREDADTTDNEDINISVSCSVTKGTHASYQGLTGTFNIDIIDNDYSVNLATVGNADGDSNSATGVAIEGGSKPAIRATLNRANNTGQTIMVQVIAKTSDSSAVAADYTGVPFAIAIANSRTSGDSSVYSITDDNLDEGSETLVLAVGTSAQPVPNVNVLAGSASEVTLTLQDTDATTVTLTTPDKTAVEALSTETAELVLTLSRGLTNGESVTVPLQFSGKTLGTHFSLSCPSPLPTGVTCNTNAGSVTFTGPSTGVSATKISVKLIASEDTDQLDDQVTVNIPTSDSRPVGDTTTPILSASGLDGGITGSRTGDGRISLLDNDLPVISISPKDARNVAEGSNAVFTLSPDWPTTNATTILLLVNDYAHGDFVSTANSGNQQVVLPGGATSVEFSVSTESDTTDEHSGPISVSIRSSTSYTIHASQHTASKKILDNDRTVASLSLASSAAIREGQSKTVTINLSRAMRNGEYIDVRLQFDVGANRATTGTDFSLGGDSPVPTGVSYRNFNFRGYPTVRIQGPTNGATATSVNFKVNALIDNIVETGGEEVSVFIATVSGTVERPWPLIDQDRNDVRFNILDTVKTAQSISLTIGTLTKTTVTEGSAATTITAALGAANSTGSAISIPIQVQTSGTTAQTGDYTLAATSISIAANSISGTTTLTTVNDTVDEPREEVVLELGSSLPSGFTASSNNAVTINIVDNDETVVRLSRTDTGNIAEGGTNASANAEFTVTLPRALIAGERIDVPLIFSGTNITTGDFSIALKAGSSINQGVSLSNPNTLAPLVILQGAAAQSAVIVLTPTDDVLVESNETLTVAFGPDGTGTNGFDRTTLGTKVDGGAGPHTTGTPPITERFNIIIESDDTTNLPILQVSAGSTVTEGTAASFTISASPTPSASLTVSLTIVEDSSDGQDCVHSSLEGTKSTTLPSTGSVTYTVATQNDSTDEPDCSLTLTIVPGQGYAKGSANSATVIIKDNDEPEVKLPVISVTAGGTITEGQTATFTFTANPAPTEDTLVDIHVSEYTQAGQDFVAATLEGDQTVMIAANATSTTFTIQTQGDLIEEDGGSVTVVLQEVGPSSTYTLGQPRRATVNINDDDASTSVRVSVLGSGSIVEGDETHYLSFIVRLHFPGEINEPIPVPHPSRVVSVNYETRGITATEREDFSPASGTLIFSPMENEKTIRVNVYNDEKVEETETFVLELSRAHGANVEQGVATGTILDREVRPVVSVSVGDDIFEGETAHFEIQISPAPLGYMIVDVNVRDNGSFVPVGEVGTRQVYVDPRGSTLVSIPTIDDNNIEEDATLDVSIMPSEEQYAMSDSSSTVHCKIYDNDGPDNWELTVNDPTVQEQSGAKLVFEISLNRAAQHSVFVAYQTENGTARGGEDFQHVEGTAWLRSGELVTSVEVPVIDDSHDERNEYMTLRLSKADGARITKASGNGTIYNSDPLPSAWLGQLGSNLAMESVEAITDRLGSLNQAKRKSGFKGTVAGRTLSSYMPINLDESISDHNVSNYHSKGRLIEYDTLDLKALAEPGGSNSSLNVAPLLTSSSFEFAGEDSNGRVLGLWGRLSSSRLSHRDSQVAITGEVLTSMIGADYVTSNWVFGASLMQSDADGKFQNQTELGNTGSLTTKFQVLLPYVSYRSSERTSVWGIAGHGIGEFQLEKSVGLPLSADAEWLLLASGFRSRILGEATSPKRVSWITDGVWTNTSSTRTHGLSASSSTTARLRFGLESEWSMQLRRGDLKIDFTLAALHNQTATEDGLGTDLGGGISWVDKSSGFSFAVDVRSSQIQNEFHTRYDRIAYTFGYDANPDSTLGSSFRLTQAFGQPQSPPINSPLSGLSNLRAPIARSSLQASTFQAQQAGWMGQYSHAGYAFRDAILSKPFFRFGLSSTQKDIAIGWNIRPVKEKRVKFALELETTRVDARLKPTDHGVGANLRALW